MEEESVKAIARTAKELAKPVYEDGLQPVTKEVGKSLQTMGGLINTVLMPIAIFVHGFRELEEKIKANLTKKLTGINKEDIVTPPLNVVGPLLEKYRYNYDNDALADMFISLLANSMDRNRTNDAHPSFIDIIGQLSPDEAKLLKNLETTPLCPKIDVAIENVKDGGYNFIRKNIILGQFLSGLQYIQNTETYLENLSRLSLVSYTAGSLQEHYTNETLYAPLLGDPFVKNIEKSLNPELQKIRIFKGHIELTSFGKMFFRAVTR